MLDEIRLRLEGVPFEITFNHGTHDYDYGPYPIFSQAALLQRVVITSG